MTEPSKIFHASREASPSKQTDSNCSSSHRHACAGRHPTDGINLIKKWYPAFLTASGSRRNDANTGIIWHQQSARSTSLRYDAAGNCSPSHRHACAGRHPTDDINLIKKWYPAFLTTSGSRRNDANTGIIWHQQSAQSTSLRYHAAGNCSPSHRHACAGRHPTDGINLIKKWYPAFLADGSQEGGTFLRKIWVLTITANYTYT